MHRRILEQLGVSELLRLGGEIVEVLQLKASPRDVGLLVQLRHALDAAIASKLPRERTDDTLPSTPDAKHRKSEPPSSGSS